MDDTLKVRLVVDSSDAKKNLINVNSQMTQIGNSSDSANSAIKQFAENLDRIAGTNLGGTLSKVALFNVGFKNDLVAIANYRKSLSSLKAQAQELNDIANKAKIVLFDDESMNATLQSVNAFYKKINEFPKEIVTNVKADISPFMEELKVLDNKEKELEEKWSEIFVKNRNHPELKSIEKEIDVIRKKAANISIKASNVATKDIEKLAPALNNASSSATATASSLGLLAGAIAVVTAAFVKLYKASIQAASALEEVQNVVEVSFAESTQKMEDFANAALKMYGMSEYSAKAIGSNFMAMANGVGIANDKASDMAITLTALAGDMASFFNTTTDVTKNALNSVFTGETETLKKYGIVMTEANLEAYRLAQGIRVAYKDMDEASKATLRYNFVLSKSVQEQGDFARTQSSWSNQTKLLKENLKELTTVIGGPLTEVLASVLVKVNALLDAIIKVERVWIASIQAVVQWVRGEEITAFSELAEKLRSMQDNLTVDYEFADGFKSASEAVDKVTKSTIGFRTATRDTSKEVAKLRQLIGGFDELNIFQKATTSSGSDSGDYKKRIGNAPSIEGMYSTSTDNNYWDYKLNQIAPDESMEELAASIEALAKAYEELKKSIVASIPKEIENRTSNPNYQEYKLNQLAPDDSTTTAWNDFFNNFDERTAGSAYNFQLFTDSNVANSSDSSTKAGGWFSNLFKSFNSYTGDSVSAYSTFTDSVNTKSKGANTKSGGFWSKLFSNFDGYTIDSTYGYADFTDSVNKSSEDANKKSGGFWSKLFGGIDTGASNSGTQLASIGNIAVNSATYANDNSIGIWGKLFGGIVQMATTTSESFTLMKDTAVKDTKDTYSATSTSLADGETLGERIKNVWQGVKTDIGNAGAKIKGIFSKKNSDDIAEKSATMGTTIGTNINSGIQPNIIKRIKGNIAEAKKDETLKSSAESLGKGLGSTIGKAMGTKISASMRAAWKADLENREIKVGIDGNGQTSYSSYKIKQIQGLARGGVIDAPTLALIGEGTNAHNNPEIVAPQSILKETLSEGNGELSSVVIQCCRQLISAIENKDTSVYLSDTEIAKSASRGNRLYRASTGASLF